MTEHVSDQPVGESAEPVGTSTSPSTSAPKPKPEPPKPEPPKPGPRPGAPKPGPRPAQSTPETAIRAASDPATFGRIDESGAVWLKTTDGERKIGSWQAGTPAEGLAHFGRRYDDLSTEVELLEERLTSRTGDPKKTRAAATDLLRSLPTAAVIGDMTAIEKRLATVIEDAEASASKESAQREERRATAIARKEELAAEAESIGAESTQWKAAGDRLRTILDEWKAIKGVDRKTDDLLWKRYSRARDAFNRRRRPHFAELDRERAGAKSRKEELIVAAEALSDSTDWQTTAAKFREMLVEWKAAGRAPRDTDDALWARFKAAQDVFFAARKAATADVESEQDANAAAKQALLAEAEHSVRPEKDLEAAKRAFSDIRDRWDEVGRVPREKMQALESRFRAVEKRIRDAENAKWHRTDPAAAARAEQFIARAAQYEEQARKAEAAGKSADAAALREQAAQWHEWANTAQGAISDR